MSVSDTAELLAPVHLEQVSQLSSELDRVISRASTLSDPVLTASSSTTSESASSSAETADQSVETMKSTKKHVSKLRLMFQKPTLSRDRGLIRVCRHLPNSICDVSIMSEAWSSVRIIDPTSKKRKFCLPILYLSEWNTLPQSQSVKSSHHSSSSSMISSESSIDSGSSSDISLSKTEMSKSELMSLRNRIFGEGLIRGFPKLQVISHKGNFAKLMRSHCKRKGLTHIPYFPMTAVLPDECEKVLMECEKERQSKTRFTSDTIHSSSSDESLLKETIQDGNEESYWILKPQGSSKGAGIVIESYTSVFNNLRSDPEFYSVGAHHEKHARRLAKRMSKDGFTHVGSARKMLAQKYVSNPLLIDGRKFDLRLYLLITSVNPMCVYIYTKGLVRFAATKYTPLTPDRSSSSLLSSSSAIGSAGESRTMKVPPPGHLTNFAVNTGIKGSDSSCSSDQTLKWTLDQFWEFLDTHSEGRMSREDMWYGQIHEMVSDMFNAARHKLELGYLTEFGPEMSRNHGRCFDLLGMDVLIDDNYHCWLIETNRYCSLRCTTEYDDMIKPRLIQDLLTVLSPRLNARSSKEIPVELDHSNTFWEPINFEIERGSESVL